MPQKWCERVWTKFSENIFCLYFNILPCVFLINDVNVLTNIAATEYYLRVLKFFNWHRNDGDEETYEDQEEKNSDRAKVDEGKDHKHVKQIKKGW